MGVLSKSYLQSYAAQKFRVLNDMNTYFDLTIKKVWFWGLFTTTKVRVYKITPYHPVENYINHWDALIRDNKELK